MSLPDARRNVMGVLCMRRTDLILRFLAPIVAGTLLTAGCTRDPFDRERPEKRYEDLFSYQDILPLDAVYTTAFAAPDGRIGMAVAVGTSEVRVLEEAAGMWSEAAHLSGNGLRTTMLDIAPGPLGGWWLLGGDAAEGARIYRIGGVGDSTLSIPVRPEGTAWDSTGGVIGGDAQGDFVAFLKERSGGIYRTTLADTGWTYQALQGTSGSSRSYDLVINGESEHLLYQSITDGTTQYWRDNGDSVHTSTVSSMDAYPALAVGPDDEAWALGVDENQLDLRLWRQFDGFFWQVETVPVGDMSVYPVHFSLQIPPDQQPNILFAAFRGTERYDLIWGTRPPEVTGINWDLLPVVEDAPREGLVDRQRLFGILLDGMDEPHIVFATGAPGDFTSILVEAVPKP